ncbi:Major facilitator superfamily domain, general substrate transporter [Cynara cardunculus var. scolymus]|uniref:Major facilitator superfamily domain, general substrate transporter n=1 Tax=Cynara cardunculus var. scolymus TaxID=59895 RepID=A0A103Y8T4_CYNCS|nr:Major facilitator superfamily domain, general substrate transporter [Cynara cardunculus var. scolymus]
MVSNNLSVLDALDTARTQWYHVNAIVIAGLGFFTDAYDPFCISTVSKLLGHLYFSDHITGEPGKLPTFTNNIVTGVALIGTLTGQLVRLACPRAVIGTLCFFRFWLGFGIGRDYPLSATIMSEYANKKTRGALSLPFSPCRGWVLYSPV